MRLSAVFGWVQQSAYPLGIAPIRYNLRTTTVTLLTLVLASLFLACTNNRYRCLERTQEYIFTENQSEPQFEIDYVMIHGNDEVSATCVTRQYAASSCTLRQSETYECVREWDADHTYNLRCKDEQGGNVYLYIRKTEEKRRHVEF